MANVQFFKVTTLPGTLQPNAFYYVDNAVSLAHSHANKVTLDKLGADADGLLYDGQPIHSRWDSLNW